MNRLTTVTLRVKKDRVVSSYSPKSKQRFLYRLKATPAKGRLFKVVANYNADGYKTSANNESCWGNKVYVEKCYKEFTSEQLIKSL